MPRFALLILALSSFLLLSAQARAQAFDQAPAHAAQRVITLTPHATELACAAGLCDQLIAVSEYSDYPKQVKRLEKVANYQGIKLERILTLQPDLVIAWSEGSSSRELNQLRQLGIPIYLSSIHSLEDIARNIDELSQYSADPTQGDAVAEQFRQQLSTLQQQYANATPIRYFYQLSEQPLITLAQSSWPSEVFRLCGGENIVEHSRVPYPQVSIEQVILAKPDIIFTTDDQPPSQRWQAWANQLPAAQPQQIKPLTADWLNRPTPRTLNAITEVCHSFDQVRQNLRSGASKSLTAQ